MNYQLNVVTKSVPGLLGQTPGVWRFAIRDTNTNATQTFDSEVPTALWENPSNGTYEIKAQRMSTADEPIGPQKSTVVTVPLPSGEMVDVADGVTVTAAP